MAAAVTPAAPNPVVDILIRARALIAPDGRWTQCAMARNFIGQAVDQASPHVFSRCASAALRAAAGPLATDLFDITHSILMEAIDETEAIDCPAFSDVADWNDFRWRTHAEVLAEFDRAIERARATGGQP
jgi:hypothetical protein